MKKIAGIFNVIDPAAPDATRVDLTVDVRVVSVWTRVGLRTYLFPRPGRYHFGVFVLPMGDGLAHQFGVIEDEESREIRVDANGNGDFRDETPMGDYRRARRRPAADARPPCHARARLRGRARPHAALGACLHGHWQPSGDDVERRGRRAH